MNSDEEVAKAAVLEEFLWVDLVGPEFKRLGEQHFAKYKAEHIEERWNGNYIGYALSLPPWFWWDSGMSCWRGLKEWQEAGVWERLHLVLLNRLGEAD